MSDGTSAFHFSSKISISFQNLIIWMMNPNRNKRPKCASEIIQCEKTGVPVQKSQSSITNSVNKKDVVANRISRESVSKQRKDNFFVKKLILWVLGICFAFIAFKSFSLHEEKKSTYDSSLNNSEEPVLYSSAKIKTTTKKYLNKKVIRIYMNGMVSHM